MNSFLSPPPSLAAPPSRSFVALAAGVAVVALVLLVRLAVFAGHPEPPPAWSVAPWSPWMTRHACSTAYWEAATRITESPDVWDNRGYVLGQDPATGRPILRTIGKFVADPYEYPPTFLLAPRALAVVAPDYVTFRHVWLILNAVFVVAGMALVGRQLDAATGRRTLWLLPLALAVVGKMFPAVLLVYLALRRDWRAVGWTAAWTSLLVIVTIADVGWAPFPFFLDQLPGLLSGEAFPMLHRAISAANNMSVPGLVLKLPAFGGPQVPFEALKYCLLYTSPSPRD